MPENLIDFNCPSCWKPFSPNYTERNTREALKTYLRKMAPGNRLEAARVLLSQLPEDYKIEKPGEFVVNCIESLDLPSSKHALVFFLVTKFSRCHVAQLHWVDRSWITRMSRSSDTFFLLFADPRATCRPLERGDIRDAAKEFVGSEREYAMTMISGLPHLCSLVVGSAAIL